MKGKKNIKQNEKIENKVKLGIAVSFKMANSDLAFAELVGVKNIDPNLAKHILSLEAGFRRELSIVGPEKPIVLELIDFASCSGDIPDLLQLFYGVLSCAETQDKIKYTAEEILEAIQDALKENRIEELLKNPASISKFFPKNELDNEVMLENCNSEFLLDFFNNPQSMVIDALRDQIINSENPYIEFRFKL